MQRQRQNKQKKSNYKKFEWNWQYLDKPTIKRKMTLDEMIEKWLQDSKERLKYLED